MRIVIVGGGTAGWISALFMQKLYQDAEIILVHDNNTPIIGVGEGTTPIFMDMMTYIGIDISDLIRNCEATVKYGIKFTNWNGDGTSYIHSFESIGSDYMLNILHKGKRLDDFLPGPILANENKHYLKNHPYIVHAVHFNAKKLAEYLENVGIQRGIKIQIGKVQDVLLDDDGYVTDLILDTKQTIKTDFVIDCTGFAKLFVGKIYNSEMTTYENMLLTNRALAFFIEKNGPTPPYTEAIAMKYGWLWKIPVGERYGCGYIFDSNLVSDEDAYDEICEVIGQKPEIRKKISFKPGYHNEVLNRNTLAVGLSHGFLEPLEATSLHIAIDTLFMLPDIRNRHSYTGMTLEYNELIQRRIQECVDIIYFHYLSSKRDDTTFWKKYKNITDIPRHTRRKLKYLLKSDDIVNKHEFQLFSIESYLQCGTGIDYIPSNFITQHVTPMCDKELDEIINKVRTLIDTESIPHDEFLNKIKE